MYEVNLRQMTNEGTLDAFREQHLERLHRMGVEVIWLMPIHPIGEKNRKGTLGSYYSVKDYTAVNPEHGTMQDLQELVQAAHALGMKVIIDWVANHTSWDNVWVSAHPDWFTKDSTGNFVPPVPDWHDVIDLNFDNLEMRREMIRSMAHWLKVADIDGFRCDVAAEVPIEFWTEARAALDSVKPVFMLAEADKPEMHPAFHATYSWEMHHRMKQLAQGKEPVDSIINYFARNDKNFPKEAIRLQFISNHDENSWNGTMTESFGANRRAFAVMSFTVPGMPLLYAGMECDIAKRLRFFDKDTIEWADYPMDRFYTDLVALKKAHPSLASGAEGGELFWHRTDSAVVAYSRRKGDDLVHVVLNLRDTMTRVSITDEMLKGDKIPWPYGSGKITLSGNYQADLEPNGYVVLTSSVPSGN